MEEILVVLSILHVYTALVWHANYLRSTRTAVGRWFLGWQHGKCFAMILVVDLGTVLVTAVRAKGLVVVLF